MTGIFQKNFREPVSDKSLQNRVCTLDTNAEQNEISSKSTSQPFIKDTARPEEAILIEVEQFDPIAREVNYPPLEYALSCQ